MTDKMKPADTVLKLEYPGTTETCMSSSLPQDCNFPLFVHFFRIWIYLLAVSMYAVATMGTVVIENSCCKMGKAVVLLRSLYVSYYSFLDKVLPSICTIGRFFDG
jgi:hypothetical protein